MAGVTSDVLNNMLRSTLNDLKSFVEILNAELTEEGQGEESRVTHKEDISRVLHEFGECEAYLETSTKCLQEVEEKINNHFDDDSRELIEQKTLHDEISSIIKIIDGKDKLVDNDQLLGNIEVDENRINEQLKNIQDVLDEFHPLKFAENGDDDNENEAEENRISRQLEQMQKKAMKKLEKRLSNVGAVDDDEEYAALLDRNEELSDLSDDETIDYDSLEKYESRQGGRNDEAKKNMDMKLKQMWNDYKKKLENVQSLDTKQLFAEALDGRNEVDFNNLKYFSQYNDAILELFSREAIVVVGSNTSYLDPISKKNITEPVRNKICNHIYERDTIYAILKKKKEMRCPCLGCSCRSFTIYDLVTDDEVAEKITQNLARKKASIQQDTEEMETEDEDDDNTLDVDNENDDTQSQELF